MDKLEKNIQLFVKTEKENIDEKYCEMIDNTLNNLPNKKYIKNSFNRIKISFASACGALLLISSVAFAKDIENFIKDKFNFGKGIETAIENGYISNPNMDAINSEVVAKNDENKILIEDVNTSVKINDFLMDDNNLNIEFDFEFDEKLEQYINNNSLYNIELSDLFILDENDRIIFTPSFIGKEKFDEFCNKNDLEYSYQNFNENYINSGLNSFVRKNTETSSSLIYNIYTNDSYPKSKKLTLSFKEITFIPKNQEGNTIILTGDWSIDLDVPEEFYNRQGIIYKEKSCSNENYFVTSAIVYDTYMILNIEGRNEILPENSSDKIYDDYNNNKITEEEMNKRLQEWNNSEEGKKWSKEYDIFPVDFDNLPYVENENGEKFEESLSPSSEKLCERFENGNVSYINTFTLTKYDATDYLKVVLHHKDGDIIIELEK